VSGVRTSITELPESRVRVQAEVAAEEVERSVQQAARELGRQMRVPGFRKGKVPPPVVIRRLGREAVLDEALRHSLGTWYTDAIDGAGIAPVGEPELDVGELPGEGEALSFSIEVGVRPPAALGQYKGVEVGRREPAVDDSQVDEELERMRDQLARLETVDRPAAEGDHVVVDYVGRDAQSATPFEGGAARDQLLELGAGRLIPGFEEQLVGVAGGETREIAVDFPDDYQEESLAGRRATFEVTVHEVKAKRLPELDDDFAGEAGGFDTLADLREDLASRLAQAQERAIEREFAEAVLDAVAAEADVEVPERLVHARAHEILADTLTALAGQGISREAYLRIAGKDLETLAGEAEPDAEKALRREAVLAAVVQAEGITPSDEELREALAPSAQRAGEDVDRLLERLRKSDRLQRVREEVANRQALELLVKEAKPITVEQAKAREELWMPGKERGQERQLWTPGSG
jgi:trigger factor